MLSWILPILLLVPLYGSKHTFWDCAHRCSCGYVFCVILKILHSYDRTNLSFLPSSVVNQFLSTYYLILVRILSMMNLRCVCTYVSQSFSSNQCMHACMCLKTCVHMHTHTRTHTHTHTHTHARAHTHTHTHTHTHAHTHTHTYTH